MQDYMSCYAFNAQIDSLGVENSSIATHMFNALAGIGDRILLGASLGKALTLLPLPKKFENGCHYVHNFIDEALRQAFEARNQDATDDGHAEQSADVVDFKGDQRQSTFIREMAKKHRDMHYVRGAGLAVFIGGSETTATVMANTLFNLSRNLNAQRKVVEEVARLDGRIPTFEQLHQMTYLRACIDESELTRTLTALYFTLPQDTFLDI